MTTEAPASEPFMLLDSRIYIAGHRGLVGSAIARELTRRGYTNILTRTHAELELLDQDAVTSFFAEQKPDYVFLAAAKVGGILANNTYPADFIRDNLIIQTNIIEASRQSAVKRLLFLGSSCIYPKLCPQPIKEEYLLTGPLEPTNRPYALGAITANMAHAIWQPCRPTSMVQMTISTLPTHTCSQRSFARRQRP
jgi:GDP-L-fucose synthase